MSKRVYVITISRQTARWFRTKWMCWFFHSVRRINQYSFKTYHHMDHSLGIVHSLQWWKYYSHLFRCSILKHQSIQYSPNTKCESVMFDKRYYLYLTSLLCSIKFNYILNIQCCFSLWLYSHWFQLFTSFLSPTDITDRAWCQLV